MTSDAERYRAPLAVWLNKDVSYAAGIRSQVQHRPFLYNPIAGWLGIALTVISQALIWPTPAAAVCTANGGTPPPDYLISNPFGPPLGPPTLNLDTACAGASGTQTVEIPVGVSYDRLGALDAIHGGSGGVIWAVTNNGTISSGIFSLTLFGAGHSVINNGDITATTTVPVLTPDPTVYLDSSGSITNTLGATISGYDAVASDGALTLDNSGDVTAIGTGVQTAAGSDITNRTGATISGMNAITSSGTLVVDNTGSITATNTAISATGSLTLDNDNLISGTSNGVIATSGGTITNETGATISATTGSGISSSGVLNLDNSGRISGATAISSTASVTIDNSGQISGTSIAINSTSDITVTNRVGNTISGARGVVSSGNSVINNSGTITASSTSITTGAVELNSTASGTINNNSGGLISSTSNASAIYNSSSGTLSIVNAGQINGSSLYAILDIGGATTLEIHPGSSISGLVLLLGASDALRLGGAGTDTFDVSSVGTGLQYQNVETFEKSGTSTWTLTGASSEIPTFAVNEGRLYLNADLSSTDFTVANGATLSGTGTAGSLTVNTGGIVAPGNSIGTLSVNGNVTFSDGATYTVEIAPDGSSDRIVATGTTTISTNGTTLEIVGDPAADFPFSQSYTVITAAAGVTGTFAGVTDNLPDIDFEVVYTATTVELTYGETDGLFSAKDVHPSAVLVGLGLTRTFGDSLRLRGSRLLFAGDQPAANVTTAAFEPAAATAVRKPLFALGVGADLKTDPAPLPRSRPQRGVWANVLGGRTKVEDQGARQGWDTTTTGLTFGLERKVHAFGWPIAVGMAGGFSHTNVDVGMSGADIQSWYVGATAATRFDRLVVSSTLAYAYQSYDVDRYVMAGTIANGEADGNSFGLSGEAFYDLSTRGDTRRMRFGPLVSLATLYADRNGFNETGAGILNLSVDEDDAHQTITGIGLAYGATHTVASARIAIDARLVWEHVFGDTDVTTTSYIPIADATFTTRSASISRNRLAVGLGLNAQLSTRLDLNARYDGAFSEDGSDHRAIGGVKMRF
ncbi:MAG: autotransporter domain-containing protein [Pseudomonadota bacterium]